MEGGSYLKKIEDQDYVYEILSEKFDNAIELLTSEAIVYGGAVRDCIAEKELVGDLDISVSQSSYKSIFTNFSTNSRWTRLIDEDQKPLPNDHNPYEDGDNCGRLKSTMNGITTFTGVNNQIVQLMTPKQSSSDGLLDALVLARTVDIICCGIVLLSDGRVFETVPGAYEDCINGVLRLNEYSGNIVFDRTSARINKLMGRGWKNETSKAQLKKYSNRSESRKERIAVDKIPDLPKTRLFGKAL